MRTDPEAIDAATPFRSILRAEFGRSLGRRHFVSASGLALLGVLLAYWLPLFPRSVHRFFAGVLGLESWPEIVIANNFTGIFFCTYWIGAFDLLLISVVPREERYLDLLLSKPLTRRAYLMAKLVPILLIAIATGLIAASAHWLGMRGAGLDYDPSAYAGSTAIVLAWSVCLIALTNVLILQSRDAYSALLIAFIPGFATMFPGAISMYRPDIFDGMPALRNLTAFPMNLLWFPEVGARQGWAIAAMMLAVAAAFIAWGGWRIERDDVA